MTGPYTPVQFAAPVINPSVGSVGAPPIPYISNSVYLFAPPAMDPKSLNQYGVAGNAEALADSIRRATAWANNYCFGADPSSSGASLAASLSVESVWTTVKLGMLRLICDYRPIIQVTGVDVGDTPGNTASIGPTAAANLIIERRTIKVPFTAIPMFGPPSDPGFPPGAKPTGGGYAVGPYVTGTPHTTLASSVTAGATTCVVQSTDGAGGLWGVFPASGSFPGTRLTIYDGSATESVFVTAVTTGTSTTTLTTTPFANPHTVPAAPDFLPVSAIPADIQQACISLTTMLIKLRGARSRDLPREMGGMRPGRTELAQAGALEDWNVATRLLQAYRIPMKTKV